MLQVQLKYLNINELKENPHNARKHPQKQLQKLAANIKRFDFLVPAIIDKDNIILSGHARVEAAKMAGLKEVPTIKVEHLSKEQARAFAISDNRLSQDSSWDMDKLKAEFEFLSNYDIELSFTGFETPEIDWVLGDEKPKASKEDEVEDISANYIPVTMVSDIWDLGNHRLICGDAQNTNTYESLMVNEKANIVFTDPPYNDNIRGHVKSRDSANAREFVMASGEMSRSEFTNFLREFLTSTALYSVNGSILYVCMDWRHIQELLSSAEGLLEFKQLCVWSKDRAGMGSFYRSQHELVCVFKYGDAKHINNFGLGNKGRYRTNIWNYPVVGRQQPEMDGIEHPTVKPVSMIIDAIRDCSNRGDIILDPFGGSGTTLIAAEKTGRRARLIELDPIYCDLIVRRWEKYTGNNALMNGKTFEELKSDRHKELDYGR